MPFTTETLAERILDAIATRRSVSPSELGFVLYDEVDTGALNALGRHDGGAWQLSLSIDGHTVTVDSDDFVLVDGEEP